MIANSIADLVGNTPLVKLNKLSEESGATILGKCEFMNPTSSVKDRIALNMIEVAIADGTITDETTIIEPTSGNTGVGLAAVCASKGLKLILTMPESMSVERRKLLQYLGAELVLTPASGGMGAAINKAHALQKSLDNAIVLHQFQNPSNPDIHRKTTAIEIYDDTSGELDFFVASVGTGGTITGTSEVLKQRLPHLKSIAVEPANSPILSQGKAGPHKIQGIGAGFVPAVLDVKIFDEVVTVGNEDAFHMSQRVAKEEGLLVGISSGANLQAAFDIASRKENRGKTIVTILCDTAERYLSTELFDE
ncbi:Cysteine synthase [hydrothermal vent metagenome]|uniref:cysteine synthase n=1 Tax=hydrothermal vent metagenome TaxID=652676 RepID=A0A1W1B922_9ZZZZ